MDVWVRSEYAGELAVLSAWLTPLLPWSVSYAPGVAGGSLLEFRFPFVAFRYTFGIPFAEAFVARGPISGYTLNSGDPVAAAYAVWLVATLPVLAAVFLSVAYYLREQRVESLGVDPVRVLGAFLALGGGGYLVAAVGFLERFPGVTVPVGAPLVVGLGVVLLTADRPEFERDAADS